MSNPPNQGPPPGEQQWGGHGQQPGRPGSGPSQPQGWGQPPGQQQWGPPGQQEWGQQQPSQPWRSPTGQYGPPRSHGSGKLYLVLGTVAVAVIAGVVVLVLVLSGGASAKSVATDFADAVVDGDCEQARSTLSDDAQTSFGSCDDPETFKSPKDQGMTITLERVTITDEQSESAKARIAYSLDGEAVTTSYPMVKEDGDWRIDCFYDC